MGNEALLALTLLASMRLADAEAKLLEAKIGDKLAKLVNDSRLSLACEIVQNILSLVGHLANSGMICCLLHLSYFMNVIIVNYVG